MAIERKILIIDDDPSWLWFLEMNLIQWGYEVEKASNGQEGWNKVLTRGVTFMAIVSDTDMPYMDGLELLVRVRGESADLPYVLFFSGIHPLAITEPEIFRLGVTQILTKTDPYVTEKLGRILKSLKS